MASPPISSLRFVTLDGEPLTGPREWTPCYVELDLPLGQLADVAVERNGAELPVTARQLAGDVRVVAEWPRSGTGRYELVARCPPLDWQIQITAEVRPSKLSATGYATLLEDLELRLPASIVVG